MYEKTRAAFRTSHFGDTTICEACAQLFTGHWLEDPDEEQEVTDSPPQELSKNDDSDLPTTGRTTRLCTHSIERDKLRESRYDVWQDYSWYKLDIDSASGHSICAQPLHHSYAELQKCIAVDSCRLCSLIWDIVHSDLGSTDYLNAISGAGEKLCSVVQITPLGEDATDGTYEEGDLLLEISYVIIQDNTEPGLDRHPYGVKLLLRSRDKFQTDLNGDVADKKMLLESQPLRGIDEGLPCHTVEQMKTWIRDCTDLHSECNMIDMSSNSLPTRLLDVDLIQSHGGGVVYLRESINLSDETKYVTLSHCWGPKGPSLRLTQANLDDLKIGIVGALIPKTFRDASIVAKSLGIRYIWIDALCIIQDSSADWEHEASLMDTVYSNAQFNIAATSSDDSDSGLLGNYTDRSARVPCIIDANWTGHKPDRYVVHGYDEWLRCIERKVINTRAWIFQERLLALRTLHFTDTQVYWECSSLRANEIYPGGLLNIYPTEDTKALQSFNELCRQHPLVDRNLSEHTLNRLWLDIVETYTECGLTMETDKLSALAGIAKAFHATTKRIYSQAMTYTAGFWINNLGDKEYNNIICMDLLWFTRSPGRRPSTYTAPSWSWACIVGGIWCDTSMIDDPIPHLHDLEVKVESIETTCAYDPFGAVHCGRLLITGYLHRCQIVHVSQRQYTLSPAENELYDATVYDVSWIVRFGDNQLSFPSLLDVHLDDVEVARQWEQSVTANPVYFLRFLTRSLANSDGEGFHDTEGLIMTREGAGSFRRIGHLGIGIPEFSSVFATSKYEHRLDIDEYLEQAEDGSVLLAIV